MTLALNDYKDGFSFSGATADQGPFTLLGGKYSFQAIDTGTIDATLTMLMPDGTTYSGVHAAYTSTIANATFDLPPGSYKVTIGTGTSLSASLIRIPYRAA